MSFLEDCLDGQILAACFLHWGVDGFDKSPVRNKPPVILSLLTIEERTKWLQEQVDKIYNIMNPSTIDVSVSKLMENVMACEANEETINSSLCTETFHCKTHGCNAKYKTKAGIRKHFEVTKHAMLMNADSLHTEKAKKSPTLITMLLLLRDLNDAYRMCDGDRVFRDIKLVLLYFYNTGHSKYRLWVWRMLAYDQALLSPKQAFEYRWNISANVLGGMEHNIADDNLVELHVKLLKQQLRKQGPNVTFQTALTASKTMQLIKNIKKNLMEESGIKSKCYHSNASHKSVDKTKDLIMIATEINKGRNTEKLDYVDPICRINSEEFVKWCHSQADIMDTLRK